MRPLFLAAPGVANAQSAYFSFSRYLAWSDQPIYVLEKDNALDIAQLARRNAGESMPYGVRKQALPLTHEPAMGSAKLPGHRPCRSTQSHMEYCHLPRQGLATTSQACGIGYACVMTVAH